MQESNYIKWINLLREKFIFFILLKNIIVRRKFVSQYKLYTEEINENISSLILGIIVEVSILLLIIN